MESTTTDYLTLMAVDPGLHNTGVIVLKLCLSRLNESEILYSKTFDLSATDDISAYKPGLRAALCMKLELQDAVKDFKVAHILVEYQPPINRAKMLCLIRWNSWVEGYLFAALDSTMVGYSHSSPADVKKYFKIKEKAYHKRKRACVLKARELLPNMVTEKMSDHIADCVLMCFHHYLTQIHYDQKI